MFRFVSAFDLACLCRERIGGFTFEGCNVIVLRVAANARIHDAHSPDCSKQYRQSEHNPCECEYMPVDCFSSGQSSEKSVTVLVYKSAAAGVYSSSCSWEHASFLEGAAETFGHCVTSITHVLHPAGTRRKDDCTQVK